MVSQLTEIQQLADKAAKGMVREHREFADPDMFEMTLGWYKFHVKRGFTPKQRAEFLEQYRRSFKEATK